MEKQLYLVGELEGPQVLHAALLEVEALRSGSGAAGSTAGRGEGSLVALFLPGGSEAGCWLWPRPAASWCGWETPSCEEQSAIIRENLYIC